MESTREHNFLVSVAELLHCRSRCRGGPSLTVCEIKLVLVGSSGVGKTCLIQRYNGDPYNPDILPSISGDWLVRKIEVGGKRVKLRIWDTSGVERLRPLTTSYYRYSNGVFLVYDVASEGSFNGTSLNHHLTISFLLMRSDIQSYWSQSVNQHAPEKATKILVGNKSDLIERRVVSTKRGEELADKLGIPFFEVSAKNNLELGKAFHTMTLLITKTLMNDNEPGDSQSGVVVDPKANSKSPYLRNLAGLFARSRDQSNRASMLKLGA
jgi:Ras-related protein Rab-8A